MLKKTNDCSVIILEGCSKQVCVHLPEELLLAAKDVAEEKGYKSVPKYIAALVCLDLVHEISDWSKYQQSED